MIALLHVASAAPPPRIAIVGSGPAGLTLAHALNTLPGAEYEATVYEKYDGVSTAVGGGLQLSSGAATNLSPQVRDRMHQSCELLDSVGELIDLDEKSKPIRVMGFPAEPPAVTGVVTVVLLAFTFLSEGLLAGEIQFVGGEEGSQSV